MIPDQPVTNEPVTEDAARPAFGTLATVCWSGENPADGLETAFLLAYSLGDTGEDAQAGEAGMRALLEAAGLHVGGLIEEDGPAHDLRLRRESGQAVVTMPGVRLHCAAPAKWLMAAEERGHVYVLFATRPWPEGIPGDPISEEDLRAFLDAEGTLATSAHCVLPLRRTGE
jgi:hypothetical protein